MRSTPMDSDTIYVLCCHSGSGSYEPYVAVFTTLEAAQAHYETLEDMQGACYFIERQRVNVPGEYETEAGA